MFSFIRLIPITVLAAGVIWCWCPAQTAFAQNQVITHVKVIQASTHSRSVDPALRRIVPELEKVFRYTGYTLLQDKTLSLAFDQQGFAQGFFGHLDLAPDGAVAHFEVLGRRIEGAAFLNRFKNPHAAQPENDPPLAIFQPDL